MEQANFEPSLGTTSSAFVVENTEYGSNLNLKNQSSIADDEVKNLIQEKEITAADEDEKNVLIDLTCETDIHISSSIVTDHDYDMQTVVQPTARTQTSTKSSLKQPSRYLLSWEQQPESFYKTYTFDICNNRYEKLLCWLYKQKR